MRRYLHKCIFSGKLKGLFYFGLVRSICLTSFQVELLGSETAGLGGLGVGGMSVGTTVQRRRCNSRCISAAGHSGETRELEINPESVVRQEKVERCCECKCAHEGCGAANPTCSQCSGRSVCS